MQISRIIALLALLGFALSSSADVELKSSHHIIYGNDDRYEVPEYSNPAFQILARSVAIMANAHFLTEKEESDVVEFDKITAKETYNLCEEEKFSEQYSLGKCSGFLISPELLVTAGHCVQDENDCTSYSWVFDYQKGADTLNKNNIYRCNEIVARDYVKGLLKYRDYAIIKLDRPVLDRPPLKFRRYAKILSGSKLVVIGNPLGVHTKIVDNVTMAPFNWSTLSNPLKLIAHRDYFFANADSFIGNSGSPVFNKDTLEVEGILLQGGKDFVLDEDKLCNISAKEKDSMWKSKEKVMRMNRIPEVLELVKESSYGTLPLAPSH